jgi:hypothetical protein
MEFRTLRNADEHIMDNKQIQNNQPSSVSFALPVWERHLGMMKVVFIWSHIF